MDVYAIKYKNIHNIEVTYSAFVDPDDAYDQVDQLMDSADWIGYVFWVERVTICEPPKKKLKLG